MMQILRSFQVISVLVFVIFCLYQPIFAEGGNQLLSEVQERYEQIKSLKIEFKQTLINNQTGEKDHRQGQIYFRHPRFIRWQTESPHKELIIVNKEDVWNYVPKEKIAYKYSFRQMFESKNFISFLTGETNINKDFIVENKEKGENGWLKFVLKPKEPEISVVSAKIWVDPESYLLRRLYFEDYFNNGNQITCTQIELNPELNSSIFRFSPPEDVEIIDNTSP